MLREPKFIYLFRLIPKTILSLPSLSLNSQEVELPVNIHKEHNAFNSSTNFEFGEKIDDQFIQAS